MLKESDDLDILGVTFDYKVTFEKHLLSVSRAACQRLEEVLVSIPEKITCWEMLSGFGMPISEYCSAVCCLAADTHHKPLDLVVSGAHFLTGCGFECDISCHLSVVLLRVLYK